MVLQKMSTGAKNGITKFVLLGFLFMAVAGLVLTDVQGFFRGGLSVDTVAKGGGVRISTQEFDRTVRRILAAQGMSAQDAYRLGLIDQILQGEIQARLMAKEAKDLGLIIDNDTLMAQIAKIAEPLTQGGGSKAQALQQILRSQGIGEQEFIEGVREEMAIGLLRTALISGADTVPDALALAVYQNERQTRSIEAVIFSPGALTDIVAPAEESLRAYYEANKIDYATFESRDVTLAILTEAAIEDRIAVTDEALREAYERNINAYKKPAQREIEQAVFTEQDAAQDAYDSAANGAPLQQATGGSYLGKNSFEQSGLLPEVAGPVFEAKAGDVVGPIESPLGWHVIVVGKDVAEQITPFEKVKDALSRELRQSLLMDEVINEANDLDDRLAGGEKLETLVDEYGLTTQKISGMRQAGVFDGQKPFFESFGPEAGNIIDTAFSYDAGDVAPVMETTDGRFITVRIDAVTPTTYKPFEQVKSDLAKKWIAEQRALANRARAQDALKKAEGGASLEEIAQEYKARVQTFSDVTRSKSQSKAISEIALAKIFSVDAGDTLLAESGKDIVLARVTGISLPDASKVPEAQLNDIKAQLARDQMNETLMQYVMNRGMTGNVKINAPLLRRMYGAEG